MGVTGMVALEVIQIGAGIPVNSFTTHHATLQGIDGYRSDP